MYTQNQKRVHFLYFCHKVVQHWKVSSSKVFFYVNLQTFDLSSFWELWSACSILAGHSDAELSSLIEYFKETYIKEGHMKWASYEPCLYPQIWIKSLEYWPFFKAPLNCLGNEPKIFHNLEMVSVVPDDGFVFRVTFLPDTTKIKSLAGLNVSHTTGTKMTLANFLQLNLQFVQVLVSAALPHFIKCQDQKRQTDNWGWSVWAMVNKLWGG